MQLPPQVLPRHFRICVALFALLLLTLGLTAISQQSKRTSKGKVSAKKHNVRSGRHALMTGEPIPISIKPNPKSVVGISPVPVSMIGVTTSSSSTPNAIHVTVEFKGKLSSDPEQNKVWIDTDSWGLRDTSTSPRRLLTFFSVDAAKSWHYVPNPGKPFKISIDTKNAPPSFNTASFWVMCLRPRSTVTPKLFAIHQIVPPPAPGTTSNVPCTFTVKH